MRGKDEEVVRVVEEIKKARIKAVRGEECIRTNIFSFLLFIFLDFIFLFL